MTDPASDYIWTDWGRHGRCLPIDGEAVGQYECAHCGRPITREMDPETPCGGRPAYRTPTPIPPWTRDPDTALRLGEQAVALLVRLGVLTDTDAQRYRGRLLAAHEQATP